MPKKNSQYRERRAKMLNFMKEAGAWKISSSVIKELAEKYGVSERQIYKDRLKVIQAVPKPKVDETSGKFLISYDSIITKAIELARNQNPEIAAKGVKLYFEAVDSYTKFLENYELKPKVADKHEIDINKIEFEIIKSNGNINTKTKN